MPSASKSFKEFALEHKKAQRAYIRKERERMDKAEALWLDYCHALYELGLKPMTDRDIALRRDELSSMAARIDEDFGDNETLRAAFAVYLANSRSREP